MRKFAGTIIAFIVLAGLLVWMGTRERGRVADKEEVFRSDIRQADDLVKLEVVKYDVPANIDTDDDEQADADADGLEQDADETDGPDDADSDEGAKADDAADGKDEGAQKEKADPNKRVEARRFAVERRDDEWYVTAPFEGLVDPDTAEAMMKTFVELKPSHRADADASAKEYGLDNPTMKVTGALSNGKQIEIVLGEDTPVGAKVYARISDKHGLYLVPSLFRTDMDKEPDKIRDKKLARFEKEDVRQVTFTNESGTILARKQTRGEDVTWTLTSGGEYEGDEWSITSAFGRIADVEAKLFADKPGDLKAYGLDKPRAQCQLQLKDGKSFEVLVGKQITRSIKTSEYGEAEEEKELVYVMRKGRPEVLLVESSLFDDLNKDLMALRDKRIMDFARDDVRTVKVTSKDGLDFTVIRAGDDWKLQKPEVADAQKSKIDNILWTLSDLEAKEYLGAGLDLKKVGLAVPQVVVTLELTKKRTIKVKLGDKVEKDGVETYYCQTSEGKQAYKVGSLLMQDLPLKIEDIKQADETDSTTLDGGADLGETIEVTPTEDAPPNAGDDG